MAISFVAAGTTYSNTAGGTSFTLNKPAGVADGDTLVAVVACWANGSQKTMSSSGWTVRQTAYFDTGDDEVQITLMTRAGLASDPSTWTVTSSGTVYLRVAAVAAYRGVQSVGVSGQTSMGGGTSLSTATVNNSVANSWRVTAGACFASSLSVNISSNEVTRRFIVGADNSGACQTALWDSSAGIVTGNTSRTVSRSSSWVNAGSVILILNEAAGTPASGSWASTLAKVSAEGDGEVHDDATVSATLPAVAYVGDGLGQPPEADGTVGATLPAVAASFEAGTDVLGTMDAIASVSASVVAETRAFGERVIVVERDDRTIRVESRGVAD